MVGEWYLLMEGLMNIKFVGLYMDYEYIEIEDGEFVIVFFNELSDI